jgi:hypothetical protein
MELLIAILIALGALISPDRYTETYIRENQDKISRAQTIIDDNKYHFDEQCGGVIIDDEVSTNR